MIDETGNNLDLSIMLKRHTNSTDSYEKYICDTEYLAVAVRYFTIIEVDMLVTFCSTVFIPKWQLKLKGKLPNDNKNNSLS